MFSIAVEPTYTWPVQGTLPGGVEVKFDAVFRRLSTADAKALDERAARGELSDAELIGRVLAGWTGVTDEHREPLPFTPENLFRLLNVLGVQAAIVASFYESLAGARRKN